MGVNQRARVKERESGGEIPTTPPSGHKSSLEISITVQMGYPGKHLLSNRKRVMYKLASFNCSAF